jgi:hypothetical protein
MEDKVPRVVATPALESRRAPDCDVGATAESGAMSTARTNIMITTKSVATIEDPPER